MRDQVPAAMAGERIDRVVALMTGLSRSAVRSLVEAGEVTVDDVVVDSAKQRLPEGVVVEVEVPDARAEAPGPTPNIDVAFEIVYVDDDVIVIDKPIDLVVHPGAGGEDTTLVSGLLARYPEIAEVGERRRPGIVHRLDRDTSGLLVCARNAHAYEDLVDQLSVRSVTRVYQTLVRGVPEAPSGVIDAPIGRSRRSRTRMTVAQDGREARTHYRLLEAFTQPIEASLLECRLETGRTHQIRVHLGAVGLHVLGDATYGRQDPFGVGRPLLHAAELGFEHPGTGERVTFRSELAPDFAAALTQFRADTARLAAQLDTPPGEA